jgi:hypothetical protein
MLAKLSAADAVGGRPLNYKFLYFVLTYGHARFFLTAFFFWGI